MMVVGSVHGTDPFLRLASSTTGLYPALGHILAMGYGRILAIKTVEAQMLLCPMVKIRIMYNISKRDGS